MDIEVHRAGRTFYVKNTVLLNVPERRLDPFFSLREWPSIVAAKFLGLPGMRDRRLTDYALSFQTSSTKDIPLSGAELDELLRRQASGELTPEQVLAELQARRQRTEAEKDSLSPANLVRAVEGATGVNEEVWKRAGQELLEAVMPFEDAAVREVVPGGAEQVAAARLGLAGLSLVSDFPMVTATYGYSRVDDAPNMCRLNPFPAEPDYDGRFPIYVDLVQADAIVLKLDAGRVCRWLELNDAPTTLPTGSDADASRRAYFVRLFDGIPLRETLDLPRTKERMVFGLLHTLSHLAIKHVALLCGLERTSLSEHLLPKALTVAIYCNHRFGATIGALTSLFEESVTEWLNEIRNAERCIYDPVCEDRGGSCHVCTHLSETSCRFFNLNLSRAFLFGGVDQKIGRVRGYLDRAI